MKNKVKEILALICEIDVAEIGDDASQKTIEKWDSLNHMNLIVTLETEFDIEFEDEEIIELTTLEALVDSIAAKTSA